ncbi:MAG: tetratricopeptide repeat protein [Desulfatibacillaceae bacterium]
MNRTTPVATCVLLLVLLLASCGEVVGPIPNIRSHGEPDPAVALLDLGVAQHNQGLYDEAITTWTSLADMRPEQPEVFFNRGLTWYAMEHYGRAEADYTRAMELDPDYASAYFNRGFARGQKGDIGGAIADYEKTLALAPSYPDAKYQLAWTLVFSPEEKYRNGGRALGLASEVASRKNDVKSLEVLSAAYAEIGDFRNAVAAQERAVARAREMRPDADLTPHLMRLEYYRSGRKLIEDTETFMAEENIRSDEAITFETPMPPKPEDFRYPEPKKKEVRRPGRAGWSGRNPWEGEDVLLATSIAAQKAGYPYTLQVASYRDRTDAARVARKLISRGDAAFIARTDVPGKGIWHRVFVGVYESRRAASLAREQLVERRFRNPFLVKKPFAIEVQPGGGRTLPDLERELNESGYVTYTMYYSADNTSRLLLGAYNPKSAANLLKKELEDRGYTTRVVLR